MLSNPLDVNGSLKQKGTNWEIVRDIRKDLLLMDSLKG